MEPWDGPASIAFTDGTVIGAVLDRNGLRPSRYWVTDDDLVIMASRGRRARRRRPRRSCKKGRLEPGKIFLVDTTQGRIIPDDEIKAELAGAAPVPGVARRRARAPRRPAAAVPARAAAQLGGAAAAHVRLHAGRPAARSSRRWRATRSSRSARWAPTRRCRCSPTGRACCTSTSSSCSRRSRTRRSTPTSRRSSRRSNSTIGPEGNLLDPRPGLVPPDRVPVARSSPTRSSPSCATSTTATARSRASRPFTVVLRTTRSPRAATGLRMAIDNVRTQVSEAIADGANLIILSDRYADAENAPIPALLVTAAVHHHLVREKTRTRVGLVVETGEAREVHHFALLLGYGAGAINPYLAFDTIRDLCREGVLVGPHRAQGGQELRQGGGQGHPQGDVEDGHLDGRVLHRRADLRGGRAAAGARRRVLHRHRVAHRGHRPRRDRRARSRRATASRTPTGPRSSRTASCRSAASTSGGARASTTSSTPTRSSSCSTRRARGRYDVFKEYTQLVDDQAQRLATLRGLFELEDRRARAGADRRGRAGRARSSSGSRPAR